MLNVGAAELETELGDVFPGQFALIAQKDMERCGTSLEQLAQVSISRKCPDRSRSNHGRL